MKSFILPGAMRSSALAAPAIIENPRFYANTLTALIPTLWAALNQVSREMTGFLGTVGRSLSAERVALNTPINWPVVGAVSAVNTPVGMAPASGGDVTPTTTSLSLTKSRTVEFNWTGEDQYLVSAGPGMLSVQGQIVAQAFRTLVNEMETDIWNAARVAGSRAYGTAGTTPFASNTGDLAQIKKILDDNGSPDDGTRAAVIDTTAGAAMRTLLQLTKVNEAGTQLTLRSGALLDLYNIAIKESKAVAPITKGTGASATTNTAGYAVGATVITLAATGTGTILAGDVITFAGDTNKYVVASGDADVSNGGTITLAAPGLQKALAASAIAITVVGDATKNVVFNSNAIQFAARLPAKPSEGDIRIDEMIMVDPFSGMAFEVAVFGGQRMVKYEISAVWGVKAHKPEWIAFLLG